MSLAAVIEPATVLHAVLDLIVPLIVTSAGDRSTACIAALDMLADHHPQTREELRLAAEVIGFSLHTLAALKDAAEPGIPISRVMRLRSSACALRRSENTAQRKLDILQRVSHAVTEEQSQAPAIAAGLKKARAYFADPDNMERELAAIRSAAQPGAQFAGISAAPHTASPAQAAATAQAQPTKTPGQSANPQAASPQAASPHAANPQPRNAQIPSPQPGNPRVPSPHTSNPHAPDTHIANPQVRHPQAPMPPAARPPSPHAPAAMPPLRSRIDAALQRMDAELSAFGIDAPETGEPPADILDAIRRGVFNGRPPPSAA